MQSILEKFVRQIDNFSIRKKMIFIYIFCMLLPITLTDGVIIYTVLHTEAQLRRSEMEDIADAVNYQIFYDVDTVSKVAKSIYANKYINDFLEMEYRDPFDYVVSYQEFFKDTLFQSSDMTGSSLTTLYTDNSTIVSGGRVRNLDLIKESGWYRDLNEKGTEQMLYFAYEPEVLGAVMHPERHVYFVRKMNYYGGGQSEKLLKIEMDYSTINKNLQNLNYDTPVYICHEGKIIFSNRDGENIGDEYEKFSDYKEVEYKKTSNIYGAQLEIYVLRPETDLIGKLVERLPMLLLLFSINIFFPLIMVLLLNRSLTARISRLSSIFRNTEDENLVEIENVSAKDEIGDLMRNYNRMVSRITTLVNIVYKNRILEQEMTVARQKAELLALRSQINPHFLFNALNTVYFQIEEKNEIPRRTLEILADLLRYQLYNEGDKVMIKAEIDYLKKYISLWKLRSTERLQLQVYFDEALQEQEVYPLLFVPLVENAFKYVRGEYHIKLNMYLKEDRLYFYVENTISDMLPPLQQKQGIGIENLKRRLELLYPDNYTLNIKKEKTLFKVELVLKL